MSETVSLIRSRLASLLPARLEIEDQSAMHAGHAGASQGGHFHVLIVSDAFRNQSVVSRHRAIYAALGDMMRTHIHALSIDARHPDEVRT